MVDAYTQDRIDGLIAAAVRATGDEREELLRRARKLGWTPESES